MRTETVTLTNMCMVYDDAGNVLVQDKVDKKWSGLTFPGGHIEKGESFVDSVIREVYEETGLTIEKPRICGTKDWLRDDGSRYLVVFYKTNQFSGELKSSHEGEVKWMPLEEMKKESLQTEWTICFAYFWKKISMKFITAEKMVSGNMS